MGKLLMRRNDSAHMDPTRITNQIAGTGADSEASAGVKEPVAWR